MSIVSERGIDLKVADQKGRITLGSRYAGVYFALRTDNDGTTQLTPVRITSERDAPLTVESISERFRFLDNLSDNWDGNGSVAPSPATVAYARESFAVLQAGSLARNAVWKSPHIGANERGQVTMEWWQGEKTLTLFVRSETVVEYLKSWGHNIDTEMEDGTVTSLADFIALSRWLHESSETTP